MDDRNPFSWHLVAETASHRIFCQRASRFSSRSSSKVFIPQLKPPRHLKLPFPLLGGQKCHPQAHHHSHHLPFILHPCLLQLSSFQVSIIFNFLLFFNCFIFIILMALHRHNCNSLIWFCISLGELEVAYLIEIMSWKTKTIYLNSLIHQLFKYIACA